MLTKLRIRNFKQFDDVEIELGPVTVFVGPNNSGKTTALQALALWYAGYVETLSSDVDRDRRFIDDEYRELGIAINRLDLTEIPVTSAEMLWRNRKYRNSEPIDIEIGVDGTIANTTWRYAVRFEYVNEESFTPIPSYEWTPALRQIERVHFVPAMSGIVSIEPRVVPGRLNVLVGEGRTAEVLRNIYLEIWQDNIETKIFQKISSHIQNLFQIQIQVPEYNPGRGEIRMFYRNQYGIQLDLSSAGRGLLQTMLLLAYMYRNPGAVLLLDEPDAHLEILRQRQIYKLLAEVALETGSQIIMATHSEVILKTAFDRKDTIVAFIPRPRPIRKYSDFVKSLSLIPAEDYYLADQKRWVLYTEGTTDVDILRAFAVRLNHPAASVLDLAFHKDVEGDEPKLAREHFTGLLEAIPELRAVGLFDRTNHDKLKNEGVPLQMQLMAWRQREIENYFARPVTLLAYAQHHHGEDGAATMQTVITAQVPPIALTDFTNSYWWELKLSEVFLKRVLEDYAQRMKLPIMLRKGDFYQLVEFMPIDQIDPEITEKLDAILEVAQRANPATE